MKKDEKTSIFSYNLRRLRKKRGLTQEALANLSGISQRIIAHYETRASQPPLENINILAKTLKVEPSEFFDSPKKIKTDELDVSQFNSKSLGKLKEILDLPANDRADLYRMLNRMTEQNKSKKKKESSNSNDTNDIKP